MPPVKPKPPARRKPLNPAQKAAIAKQAAARAAKKDARGAFTKASPDQKRVSSAAKTADDIQREADAALKQMKAKSIFIGNNKYDFDTPQARKAFQDVIDSGGTELQASKAAKAVDNRLGSARISADFAEAISEGDRSAIEKIRARDGDAEAKKYEDFLKERQAKKAARDAGAKPASDVKAEVADAKKTVAKKTAAPKGKPRLAASLTNKGKPSAPTTEFRLKAGDDVEAFIKETAAKLKAEQEAEAAKAKADAATKETPKKTVVKKTTAAKTPKVSAEKAKAAIVDLEKQMADNAKAVRAGTMTKEEKIAANKILADKKSALQLEASKAGVKVENPATRISRNGSPTRKTAKAAKTPRVKQPKITGDGEVVAKTKPTVKKAVAKTTPKVDTKPVVKKAAAKTTPAAPTEPVLTPAEKRRATIKANQEAKAKADIAAKRKADREARNKAKAEAEKTPAQKRKETIKAKSEAKLAEAQAKADAEAAKPKNARERIAARKAEFQSGARRAVISKATAADKAVSNAAKVKKVGAAVKTAATAAKASQVGVAAADAAKALRPVTRVGGKLLGPAGLALSAYDAGVLATTKSGQRSVKEWRDAIYNMTEGKTATGKKIAGNSVWDTASKVKQDSKNKKIAVKKATVKNAAIAAGAKAKAASVGSEPAPMSMGKIRALKTAPKSPLIKPPSAGTSTGPTGPSTSTGKTPAKGIVVIKRGDTLWDIAQKYNTTVADIYKANPVLAARKKAGKVQIFRDTKVRIPK